MKYYLILFTFLFLACGSRKVELSKSEKETQNDISENTTVNLNYKTDRMILEPFNPDRAILINGKTYENTKIVIEREEGVQDTKTTFQDKTVAKEETKDKKTERDNTTLFIILGCAGLFFLFLFFLIIIFGLYIYFRKFSIP
jgi:ABC-type Fe3+-hydroxamate transport system substrate-binding protein